MFKDFKKYWEEKDWEIICEVGLSARVFYRRGNFIGQWA